MLQAYEWFLWGMAALAVVVFVALYHVKAGYGPEDREPIGVVPDGVAGFHCDVPVLVLLVAPF